MDPTSIRGIQYSDHSSLNTLELCIPSPDSISDKSKIWIVFIHGGAWRDPAVLANIFDKSEKMVLQTPAAKHIAAFASINYRLSPYPTHELQPKDPNDPARNALHPDHINDILDGIAYLQREYGFGSRYILAGHSAGATLAFQVCMSRTWSLTPDDHEIHKNTKVVPPAAVLGIEGIYDIPAMIEYHKTRPYYEIYNTFFHSAFGTRHQQRDGTEVDAWSAVSPTNGRYENSWANGSLVVLAHSHNDELVEWEQVTLVKAALEREGWGGQGARKLALLELQGQHDQVWRDGWEVARAVETTITKLVALLDT